MHSALYDYLPIRTNQPYRNDASVRLIIVPYCSPHWDAFSAGILYAEIEAKQNKLRDIEDLINAVPDPMERMML